MLPAIWEMSTVAAPARCSWQGKVRSSVASGRAVKISVYEQYFMSSDVSNAFYSIKDVKVQNMLISRAFIVNNISGYDKFFPVFFFKYNPKNLPFQAGFLTFLVIYHKNKI